MFTIILLLFTSLLSSAELTIIDHIRGAEDGQRFGDRVEGLGDINGDGFADFLVTEFRDLKLHLYLGGTKPFDNPPVLTWENHGDPDGVGSFSPVNVGDIDCDGVNDFITLFAKDDTLKLFLGMESLDFNDFIVVFADTVTNWIDFDVAGGGDNNNDGNPDFWIYEYRSILNNTIRGYSGCNKLTGIPEFEINRPPDPDMHYGELGNELCNTCDLNGDSIPEVIFGEYSQTHDSSGRIGIVWGSENLSTEADLIFYAPYPHAGNFHFGKDFACLKDISGDGIDDIMIGQGGRNYIYFGGKPFDTIPDIGLDWSYVSGNYMDNIGDVNDDGYNDIMFSMSDYLFSYISILYCYPGMDTLIDASWSDGNYEFALSDGNLCCMGEDKSWAGDINGDGIDDILLAPKYADIEYNDYGRVIIQSGWQEPVAVGDESNPTLPDNIELRQNHPNPFNSGTTIEFTLQRSNYTEINIYNILGELIAQPLSKHLSAGDHSIIWDGKDSDGNLTSTGIYFYQIISGDFSETKKMVLLK